MAATDQALSVPELLENIILQLPTKNALAVSQVSRGWKALIDYSPKIQQHLFLETKKSVVVEPHHFNVVENLIVMNPIYTTSLRPNTALAQDQGDDTAPDGFWRIVASTLKTLPSDANTSEQWVGLAKVYYDAERQELSKDLQAWQRSEASCRRMFLTDPPCSRVDVTIRTIGTEQTGATDLHAGVPTTDFVQLSIRDRDGVTFGLVEDLVQHALDDITTVLRRAPEGMGAVRWRVAVGCALTSNISGLMDRWAKIIKGYTG